MSLWLGTVGSSLSLLSGDFEFISSTTVGPSGSSVIEFTSIPLSWKHLHLRVLARSNRSAVIEGTILRINNDSSANYALHELYGTGTGTGAGGYGNAVNANTPYPSASSASSGTFGVFTLDLLDYSNTNKIKTIRGYGGYEANGSAMIGLSSSLWNSYSAINRISISPAYGTLWVQYTTASLYGIKSP